MNKNKMRNRCEIEWQSSKGHITIEDDLLFI